MLMHFQILVKEGHLVIDDDDDDDDDDNAAKHVRIFSYYEV